MKWTLPIFIATLLASVFLYTFYIDSEATGWFGTLVQLAALILAAINLNMARRQYKPEDEPYKAWSCFVAGAVCWTIAQMIDIYVEFVLQQYPTQTVADIFWIAGYLFYLFGMIILVRNFLSTGLPAGGKFSYVAIVILLLVVFVVVFNALLGPALNDPQNSLMSKFLLLIYPILDIILIGVSAVLLRISLTLRGGSLAKVWLFLCAAFVLGAIADLVFARLSDIDSDLYRYLDIPYFTSYFCMAMAGKIQRALQ
jgi:hypothetical protein